MSELVIAGGPLHLDTFDVDYGCDAIMVAGHADPEQAEPGGLTSEYHADRCPVRRYVRGIQGSVRVIVHPDATPEQLAEACDKAWMQDLGRLDIV